MKIHATSSVHLTLIDFSGYQNSLLKVIKLIIIIDTLIFLFVCLYNLVFL